MNIAIGYLHKEYLTIYIIISYIKIWVVVIKSSLAWINNTYMIKKLNTPKISYWSTWSLCKSFLYLDWNSLITSFNG